MESILLSSDEERWLVIGSNGLVGGEIAKALVEPGRPAFGAASQMIGYLAQDYVAQNLQLLESRSDKPLYVYFCAGKGGFSLDQKSAEIQHLQLRAFCAGILREGFSIKRFSSVSSLGCLCSGFSTQYSRLMRANEDVVMTFFAERAAILRLPSIYGYNSRMHRYGGLPGVMMQHLITRSTTAIYARLETRRNYLSAVQMARSLFSHEAKRLLEKSVSLNIQSAISLSVFDLCTITFQTLRKRPLLKLIRSSDVHSESHFPSAVAGAKISVNDNFRTWLLLEWMKIAQGSPS